MAGRRLNIIFERRYRSGGLGHVYICDAGELGYILLPESFTDHGPTPDLQPLCIESLLELSVVMRAIASLTPEAGG